MRGHKECALKVQLRSQKSNYDTVSKQQIDVWRSNWGYKFSRTYIYIYIYIYFFFFIFVYLRTLLYIHYLLIYRWVFCSILLYIYIYIFDLLAIYIYAFYVGCISCLSPILILSHNLSLLLFILCILFNIRIGRIFYV